MTYFFVTILILVGAMMVIKTEWWLQNFGRIAWAEEHMAGSGGSRMMYKIVGIIFIVGSVLGVTGVLGEIIVGTFGSLFGLK